MHNTKQDIGDLIIGIDQGARAAHAFVCEGAAGKTRDAFIRMLAAGLSCTAAGQKGQAAGRPCLACPACRQVLAGTSLDLVYLNKSKSSQSSQSSYKVSDVAAFIERLSMGAYGKYLIGVIEDADSMSEIVQNKLLKTLEEPGFYTIILLGSANRDNLLETVQSRCSFIRLDNYDLGAIQDECMTDSLEDASDEDNRKKLEELLETFLSTNALDASTSSSQMSRGRASTFYIARSSIEKIIKSKEDANYFLDILEDRLRDLAIKLALGEKSHAANSMALSLEDLNLARQDIYDGMNPSKVIKRLCLQICY